MGEKMVNLVGYMNGESQGCHTLWFKHLLMDKIVGKAELYKSEHELRLDKVLIYVFDNKNKQFDLIGTV